MGEDKNICHYFIFVIKKVEQRYTLQIHNIQIKNSVLFSGRLQ